MTDWYDVSMFMSLFSADDSLCLSYLHISHYLLSVTGYKLWCIHMICPITLATCAGLRDYSYIHLLESAPTSEELLFLNC